jgi:hypothetical protein
MRLPDAERLISHKRFLASIDFADDPRVDKSADPIGINSCQGSAPIIDGDDWPASVAGHQVQPKPRRPRSSLVRYPRALRGSPVRASPHLRTRASSILDFIERHIGLPSSTVQPRSHSLNQRSASTASALSIEMLDRLLSANDPSGRFEIDPGPRGEGMYRPKLEPGGCGPIWCTAQGGNSGEENKCREGFPNRYTVRDPGSQNEIQGNSFVEESRATDRSINSRLERTPSCATPVQSY